MKQLFCQVLFCLCVSLDTGIKTKSLMALLEQLFFILIFSSSISFVFWVLCAIRVLFVFFALDIFPMDRGGLDLSFLCSLPQYLYPINVSRIYKLYDKDDWTDHSAFQGFPFTPRIF